MRTNVSDRNHGPLPRRTFLSQTGSALLGLALMPGARLELRGNDQTVRQAGGKVKIGVVGGGFGCDFYWHEHPDCIVEAVSDLRPERRDRLMKTYRCGKSYESLEKLILDKNVDAVAVFTGAPDHVRHCLAALRSGTQMEKDEGGFVRQLAAFEKYDQPQWWQTEMLPETLRHPSGHDGSHTFLTHEFIDALVNSRRPAIDVHEAAAYTVPGIIAHQSALQGGKQLKIPIL